MSRTRAAKKEEWAPIPPARRRHEEVVDRLRQRLAEMAPGDRLPPIRKLMADFGVSLTTMRAAQAVLAHDGLIEIRHGSGAVVREARRLRVGVLTELDALACGCGDYFRDLTRLVVHALRDHGYSPRLYIGTFPPGSISDAVSCPEFHEDVMAGHLDAVMVINVPDTEPWFLRIHSLALPAVGPFTSYEPASSHELMIEPALQELQACGAQRLALLAWEERVIPKFEEAIHRLGLKTRPEWIGGEFHPATPGSGWEAFREIWFAAAEKPDGLLVLDEMLFRDAALAIRQLGIRVPDQLRVVTHAIHQPVAPMVPFPHVRIEFDPQHTADILIQLLQRRLSGELPPVPPEPIPFTIVKMTGAEPQAVLVVGGTR